MRVLPRLFRHLFLNGLMALHQAGDLAFFGELEHLVRVDALQITILAGIRKPRSRFGEIWPALLL